MSDVVFDLFDMEFSGRDDFPFAVSVPVRAYPTYVGLFADKEICRKCCDALNRSVMRIVRSWHLKEYERVKLDKPVSFDDVPSYNGIRASAALTLGIDKTD